MSAPRPGQFCDEHFSWLCQAGQGKCSDDELLWSQYWNGLTEAEQAAELASMDRHVAESDGL